MNKNKETHFVVINHRNSAYQIFDTLKEAELNMDGNQFELRVCYPDGTYEILVDQTKYKV